MSSPPKSFCESFFSARGCHARSRRRLGPQRAQRPAHEALRGTRARGRGRGGEGAPGAETTRRACLPRRRRGAGPAPTRGAARLGRALEPFPVRWSPWRAGRGAAAQRATRRRVTGPATCPRKSELPTRSWSNTSTLRRPPRRGLSARAGLRAPCSSFSFSFSFSQWAVGGVYQKWLQRCTRLSAGERDLDDARQGAGPRGRGGRT